LFDAPAQAEPVRISGLNIPQKLDGLAYSVETVMVKVLLDPNLNFNPVWQDGRTIPYNALCSLHICCRALKTLKVKFLKR